MQQISVLELLLLGLISASRWIGYYFIADFFWYDLRQRPVKVANKLGFFEVIYFLIMYSISFVQYGVYVNAVLVMLMPFGMVATVKSEYGEDTFNSSMFYIATVLLSITVVLPFFLIWVAMNGGNFLI